MDSIEYKEIVQSALGLLYGFIENNQILPREIEDMILKDGKDQVLSNIRIVLEDFML